MCRADMLSGHVGFSLTGYTGVFQLNSELQKHSVPVNILMLCNTSTRWMKSGPRTCAAAWWHPFRSWTEVFCARAEPQCTKKINCLNDIVHWQDNMFEITIRSKSCANSGPVCKKSMIVNRKHCSSVSKSHPPWPHCRLCGSITPSLCGSINVLKGTLQDKHDIMEMPWNFTQAFRRWILLTVVIFLLFLQICNFVRWIGIHFDTCMPPAEGIMITLWFHDLPSGVTIHF